MTASHLPPDSSPDEHDRQPPRKLPRTRYPRQRAVTACRVCRERKKKCDNQRPVCSSCRTLGADCQYGTAHNEASYDAASLAILGRLSTIEELLRRQEDAPAPAPASAPAPAPAPTPTPTPAPAPVEMPPTHRPPSPPTHHTSTPPTANTLWSVDGGANLKLRADKTLQWLVFNGPLASLPRYSILTYRQELDFSYLDDTEAFHAAQNRTSILFEASSLSSPPAPSTEAAEVNRLVDRFFARVHIKNPFLDRRVVATYCQEYCEHGALFNLRACLVLLVCALGCVSPDFEAADRSCPRTPDAAPCVARAAGIRLGRAYFVAAEKRLGAAMITSSSLAVQCLCLAGIYHMCTINPLAAQAMFHSAGFRLQTLISTGADRLEGTSQVGSSLFWACYKSERELFAELPLALPTLGTPDSASGYPLPPQERFILADPDDWTRAEEDSWYFFLSEIAIRRIKDKVAEVVAGFFDNLTSADMDVALDELAPVILELKRQVLSWRENLPPRVRFDDIPQPNESEWSLHLRGPYFTQLEIMHRPFVYAAIHGPSPRWPVMDLAAEGMAYACSYLRSGHPTLTHHGRWFQMRYELVVMCAMTASAASDIKMPLGWRDAIRSKMRSLEYWQMESPSYKSYLDVIRAIQTYFSRPNDEGWEV